MRALICLVLAAVVLGSESWQHPPPSAPLVGFSYSPLSSQTANRSPVEDLGELLANTNPDLVRLPVYWEDVEPTPATLDFSSVDELMAVVENHNRTAPRPTRVVLTIGARNFLYPELHMPAWAGPREQPYLDRAQSAPPYRAYFDGALLRYRSSPLLYAWQVEDEPFDYVLGDSTGDDRITASQLSWEIGELHRLDPTHKVETSTFDAWNVTLDMLQVYAPPLLTALGSNPTGHSQAALDAADALGLDVYVDTPSTPLRFTSPDLRSVWKQQAIAFWAQRARAQGKDLWLAEMQAQPWALSTGFTPSNLVTTARDYRQESLQVVLLWGVETWLQDPAWMSAANQAMTVLRS
jgi:hypothetical protein